MLFLFLLFQTVGIYSFQTPYYGGNGGSPDPVEYLNQGRISGISSWGYETQFDGLIIKNVSSDAPTKPFPEMGQYSIQTKCSSFILQADEYFDGYRVGWEERYVSFNRYDLVRYVGFHTSSNNTYECETYSFSSDTGWIINSTMYLTGISSKCAALIDSISFQFTTITENPTSNPTYNPTYHPTVNPTTEPTKTPSINPTKMPSINPTKTPSMNPTKTPSINPTKTPSINPTIKPTSNPSLSPISTTVDDGVVLETTHYITTTDRKSVNSKKNNNSTPLSVILVIIFVVIMVVIILVMIAIYKKRIAKKQYDIDGMNEAISNKNTTNDDEIADIDSLNDLVTDDAISSDEFVINEDKTNTTKGHLDGVMINGNNEEMRSVNDIELQNIAKEGVISNKDNVDDIANDMHDESVVDEDMVTAVNMIHETAGMEFEVNSDIHDEVLDDTITTQM